MNIQVFFSNIRPQLIHHLSLANDEICAAIAWFTDQAIAEVLMKSAQKGVKVSLIVENDEINHQSRIDYQTLQQHGIQIIWANVLTGGKMHHKFCVIDRKKVLWGSYNWTYGGAIYNKENLSIVEDDPNLAQLFLKEFNQLLNEFGPKITENLQQELINKTHYETVIEPKPKPYTAYITRKTPLAMLFLIDQSGSMDTEIVFQSQTTTKAQAVALTLNTLLDEILNRCNREGELREYFQIGIIGYGNQDTDAYSAWQGALEGKAFVRMSQLRDHYLSITQTTVQLTIRGRVIVIQKPVPEWITPQSGGLKPMKAALDLAADWLEQWIVALEDKNCYPPIVINITDGEETDGDDTELWQAARRIKTLHTADGNVLLLNVHLSNTEHTPVLFPQNSNDLPEDGYTQLLYRMSSEMPALYNTNIACLTQMAFNPNFNALVSFLLIGPTTSIEHIE